MSSPLWLALGAKSIGYLKKTVIENKNQPHRIFHWIIKKYTQKNMETKQVKY